MLRKMLLALAALVLLAGSAAFVGPIAWQLYQVGRQTDLAVIHAPGEPPEVFVDGEPIQPVGPTRPDYREFSVGLGEHTLVVKQGGRVVLSESRSFQRGNQYVAYCGGPWLEQREVSYAVFNLSMGSIWVDLPTSQEVMVDGKRRELYLESQDDLDTAQDVETLHTEPVLLVLAKKDLILPYEKIPDSVDLEAHQFSDTRTALRLLTEAEEAGLAALLSEPGSRE